MTEPTQLAAHQGVRLQIAEALQRSARDNALKAIFSPAQIKLVDKWIRANNDPTLDRPEAIRRLVELGLRAKGK